MNIKQDDLIFRIELLMQVLPKIEKEIARQELLMQVLPKIEKEIARQERLLARANAEIDKAQRTLVLLHRENCEHSLKVTHWELDECGSGIIVSLTCTECGEAVKKFFNIEDGMKYFGIDKIPKPKLVYFPNHDTGTVYTVSKYASPQEALEIHLRERYLNCWRKSLEEPSLTFSAIVEQIQNRDSTFDNYDGIKFFQD